MRSPRDVVVCPEGQAGGPGRASAADAGEDLGGGLYLASEYFGFLNQADVNRINSIATPLGAPFQTTNLNWGQASVQSNFACFPQPW